MARPVPITGRELIRELLDWDLDQPIGVLTADSGSIDHYDDPQPIVGYAEEGRGERLVLLFGRNFTDPSRIRRLRYGK